MNIYNKKGNKPYNAWMTLAQQRCIEYMGWVVIIC